MKKGDIKEAEVLSFIKHYTNNHGFPPSYREISANTGIKSTNSVKKYVDRLVDKNLIIKHDNKSRSLGFNKSEAKRQIINIPILGKVAAGTPILAEENIEDALVQKELSEKALRYLHELDEPYKEGFMLSVFGGFSLKDISSIFGKSESWARVTFYRAKQKLLEKMR